MAQATQSVSGAFSGIDSSSIIEKLMTIERRSVTLLEQRKAEYQTKLEAYRSVNSLIGEVESAVTKVAAKSLYSAKSTSSSNDTSLKATAGEYAALGTYSFRVGRLAQTAKYMTTGFSDQNSSPVNTTGTDKAITIDNGKSLLNRSTSLSDINGGQGIYHGSIRVTNRAGSAATVDLASAETVDDVLAAINNVSGLGVKASVSGGRLVLTDSTGGTGTLRVENTGGSTTATDLGLDGAAAGSVLTGSDLYALKGTTALSSLRDGLGVNNGIAGRIQVSDGATNYTVDLSGAKTVQGVLDQISAQTGGAVTGAIAANGKSLELTSFGGNNLTISSVRDTVSPYNQTAEDLGIVASGTAPTVTGKKLLSELNSVQMGNISGLRRFNRDTLLSDLGATVPGTIKITDRLGKTHDFAIDASTQTLGDLMDTVNESSDVSVTLAIDPVNGRLLLADDTVGTGTLSLSDVSGTLGADLAIVGSTTTAALVGGKVYSAGVNGIATGGNLGTVRVTLNDGVPTTVDVDLTGFDASSSLSEVMDAFNTALSPHGVTMGFNSVGNGLSVKNASGHSITIADVDTDSDPLTDTTAKDLGLATTGLASGQSVNGGDLDRKYLSRATDLKFFNGGKGLDTGTIAIVSSKGIRTELNLAGVKTLGDVIDFINASNAGVVASVNETGDGVMLTDLAGGTQSISVEEVYGGQTAKQLGLFGTGFGRLDGSFEKTVTVDADDTLQDVMNKIVDSGAEVTTSIINDGSAYSPYRLVITSNSSGEAGDIVMDTTLTSFSLNKTSTGKDSLLLYGEGDASSPLLLKSSTNTNNTAVLGLSLDLKKVTSDYTTLTVSQDTDPIVTAMEDVVKAYNTLQTLVSELDTYDSETETGGLLFGDSEVRSAMEDITDMFFNTVDGAKGSVQTFFDVGLTFNDDGTLTFDTSAMAEKLSSDYASVRDLLSLTTDVAHSSFNTSATSSALPASYASPYDATKLFSVTNLINGNSNSKDFGSANGFESKDTIPVGGASVTTMFDKARSITSIALHHINSESMPAAQYSLRDFTVEYLTADNTWETLRTVSGNQSAQTYLGFMTPTLAKGIRVNATAANGDNKFRLVEIEAMESQGLTGQMDKVMNKLTDSVTGFFARQQEVIQDQIDTIDTNIEKQEERLDMVETNLVRQYTAMETALAQLQTQGNYFTSQIDAWNSSKK